MREIASLAIEFRIIIVLDDVSLSITLVVHFQDMMMTVFRVPDVSNP